MTSSPVKFAGKETFANQIIIASAADRSYWGARLGDYYFCAQAHDTFSANLNVVEADDKKGKYDGKFDYLLNFVVQRDTVTQFKFSDDVLKSDAALIEFDASVFVSEYKDKTDLTFYLKLCTFQDD